MPRIHAPAEADVKAHPREFALLCQLAPTGEVDNKVLSDAAVKYGSGPSTGASAAEGDLSFEAFAQLFRKEPTIKLEAGEGNCVGYAARDASGSLAPFKFTRRAVGPKDVKLQITHAGICHSDLHTVKNEWQGATYPLVPGHEIVGFVTEVSTEVSKFKVGDRVGVGCMVNSCGSCTTCADMKEEQYCAKGAVFTYNSTDVDGTPTYGGYSTYVLVTESFVLRVPEKLSLAGTAPLLCAGITTYSPIRKFGLDRPGMRVGVVGLGGLGHMAIKWLKALGVHATVISTSPGKREEALKVLGADAFIVSKDEEAMKAAAGSLDGIVNTVSAPHPLAPLTSLLKVDGTMVCVGVPPDPPTMPLGDMVFRRIRIAGSLIGGVKETQEMLDLAAEKGVECMHEVIPVEYVNTAYERMLKSDVRYRFVIDIQGSLIQ